MCNAHKFKKFDYLFYRTREGRFHHKKNKEKILLLQVCTCDVLIVLKMWLPTTANSSLQFNVNKHFYTR